MNTPPPPPAERMEVEEEEEVELEDISSYAIVVESQDLRNLSVSFDEGSECSEGPSPVKRGQGQEDEEGPSPPAPVIRKRVNRARRGRGGGPGSFISVASSSLSVSTTTSEMRPSTSRAAGMGGGSSSGSRKSALDESAERIRRATKEYLQGKLSIQEFAAAMEDLEQIEREVEPEEEVQEQQQPYAYQHQQQPSASLVLLDPDHPTRPSVSVLQQEEVESSRNQSSPTKQLRDEFFSSGEAMTTFTLRKKRKMPPTIRNMMGEAHLRFARGDLEGAEGLCLEIIKEQPTYKDPFHTLAMIYENQGEVSKSVQFFLISGLLDPKNFDEWPRLADLSVEEGNVAQAIMCLRKAINLDPHNVSLFIKLSELILESGDSKAALKGFLKTLEMCEGDTATYMDVSKKIAGIHFKEGELDQAYDVLVAAFNKCSGHVTKAELNLIAEVCIALKRYVKAVTLFMRYSGVRFEPSIPKANFKERNSLTLALCEEGRKVIVPVGLHSDLIQKLCIVLIHLEAFGMVLPVVSRLQETEPLQTFGIQLYEIAEAYLAKKHYQAAYDILYILVNTETYNMAEIWLRYAESLFLLDRLEDSAQAYNKVIQLAPGHKIARLNLSIILQRLGRFDTALQSINQSEVQDLIDQDLLVEKCNILHTRGTVTEFFEAAMQLFTRHCPDIRNYDEAHALVITSQTNQMLQGLKSLRTRKGDEDNDDIRRIDFKPTENAIGEWQVYVNLFRFLVQMNRPDLLNRLMYTVWSSPLFAKEERMKKDLDLQCAYASILNYDTELAPIHIRMFINTYGLSTISLKLLSLASRNCGHTRFSRKILRLLMKRPTDTRLMLLSANASFMNGTYKYALMEYLSILQRRPDDPLIHLMIATTLLHISGQKHIANKSELVAQGIIFINKYAELRGECQESFYNLGRFHHYIGLYRQALSYYKRVLITDPLEDKSHPDYNLSDLRREAALNIAQMYKASGCWMLAKRYIYRYCVI